MRSLLGRVTMLKDWLITTETVVHTLTVDLKEGTAVGLVETIYYGPKRLGKRLIHSTSIAVTIFIVVI